MPTDKMELMALAERVEQATRADRELDAQIACSRLPDISKLAVLNTPEKWVRAALTEHWNIPPYTASLDAAMTLVPKRASWSLYDIVGKRESVRMWCDGIDVLCAGATPALALTAACLRALAAQEKGETS